MHYSKQFALALSIIMLCLNITPTTGELISVSHETFSSTFMTYIHQPAFAGFVWFFAAIVAFMAIRTTFFAEQTSNQQ